MQTDFVYELMNAAAARDGRKLEITPLNEDKDIPVYKASLEGVEELPIFISKADSQILCICYLFAEDELMDDRQEDLHARMLELNIPVPLSSFSKINDQYVLFGALSPSSSSQDVLHEIDVLADNAIDALATFADYLK